MQKNTPAKPSTSTTREPSRPVRITVDALQSVRGGGKHIGNVKYND